ncbi:hypothetical protein [Roseimicrobium sp. ORNL1]|uniref:hypothetical protein n=1 Tax=Roseimicrobium sp. ORNL1 TaxID=2711231 RepID=UPI0013E1487D|nr:hypothetical protein [Roseimicrobium sp. ORNL1]QIF03637.1 hypothetical protein G5S37_19620 [Roseimicrobium sp. ORNL1]
MDPTPENIRAFHHARWKVRYTSYLLALHEGLDNKGSLLWLQQRGHYLNRYSLAKESLAAFPESWHDLFKLPEDECSLPHQDDFSPCSGSSSATGATTSSGMMSNQGLP